MTLKILIITIFIWLISLISADIPCIARKYNYDSIVCVCNSFYCDEVSKVKTLGKGKYVSYTSSLDGDRFVKTSGVMDVDEDNEFEENGNSMLQIIRTKKFQKITGFGGAFTDSTGINILSLSPTTQNKLINSYFSANGLEYNMGRVPIAGSDFSEYRYTYVPERQDDLNLKNFSLTTEDNKYKIPIIKRAMKVATNSIKLIASSWYVPYWMQIDSPGFLKSHIQPKYYRMWANYHLRFLEEYGKKNISFAAITLGNEAATTATVIYYTNRTYVGWLPQDQGIWLANHFGPVIRNSKFKNISILALDDQRLFLPLWLNMMGSKANVIRYLDGISVHWYSNPYIPISFIEETHKQYPYLYLISTEASFSLTSDVPWNDKVPVKLGLWYRAEKYIEDLFIELNNWFVGWIDWNMALNFMGGPNLDKNYADSAIIVDAENDEFLKQPLYYAIGHFSKFIPRNSIRVLTEYESSIFFQDILHIAFLREDGGITVVIYNPTIFTKTLTIREKFKGNIDIIMKPKSINTIIYW